MTARSEAAASTALVLFDLDGTLVDHDAAVDRAVRSWVAAQGWVGEHRRLLATWHAVAERHFTSWRAGATTFQGQRRARLRDFLPSVGVDPTGWSDARLDGTFAGYLRAYEQAWEAYPDAARCLRSLAAAGTAVAVLSNGDQEQQEDKLRRTGLAALVPSVLTSGGLGVAKPDPAVFALACARLGVDPAAAVYVGDRLDLDVAPARAAGLRAVWVDRSRAGAADPVARIRSLDELVALLAGGVAPKTGPVPGPPPGT